MADQKYYQGYFDYFSPGGTPDRSRSGLYDTWGDIYKYQQNRPDYRGDPKYERAERWLAANDWQDYLGSWQFAAKHHENHPNDPHARLYNEYLKTIGDYNSGGGSPSFNPNFKGNMPAGYQNLLKQWDSLRGKTDLPGAIGEGYGRDLEQWNQLHQSAHLPGVEGFDRDVGMWQDMGGRWDQAQSQADVDIEDVANYAARLRGVEEPLYAKQIRGERLGLENRLLSQGMLGSTGGASRAEALYNAQAQAAAVRDASRYQRAEGMQQQNYQNLLAALQGSQSALAGESAARQAQLGYHQQNFANQLASLTGVGTARKAQQDYYQQNFANQLARLTGAGGLFTGIHNIATDRGLGGTKGLIDLIRALGGD